MGTGVNVEDMQGALKELFLKGLESVINNSAPTLARVQRKIKGLRYVGKKMTFALRTNRSGGVRAGSEDGTLPVPGTPKRQQVSQTVMYQFGRAQISDPMIEASKNDLGAFVDELDDIMQSLKDEMIVDVNRQIWGLGNSTVTTLSAASNMSSTSGVAYIADARMLEPGDRLDICDGSYATRISAGTWAVVVAVNTQVTPHEITLEPGVGATLTIESTAAADNVTIYGSHSGSTSYEMVGLQQVMSDSETLHGLDVATYPYWKAKVFGNGGIPRDLTLTRIQHALNQLTMRNTKPTCIYCSYGILNSYLELVTTNRRFAVTGPGKIDGGWTSLKYTSDRGTLDFIADRFVPGNKLFLSNEKDLGLPEMSKIHWLDRGNGIMQRVSGKAAYDMVLAWYLNLICRNRQHQGVIEDITEETE